VPKVLSYWSYVENQLHIWLYVYTGMVLIMKGLPLYNWNIVESGVKHHNTNPCSMGKHLCLVKAASLTCVLFKTFTTFSVEETRECGENHPLNKDVSIMYLQVLYKYIYDI
jgi:hypothetical protein